MAVGLALLMLAAGCAKPPPPPLRVGLLQFPSYELFYLAQHDGDLDPQEVELIGYRSPVEAARAYDSGLLDAAALTLGYVLDMARDGQDNRVILVLDESDGADALVARPGIDSLVALRGRRVALEASALGRYFLARALERGGLAFTDIVPISVDLAGQERLYRSGGADAVVTYDPVRSHLLAAGAHELFTSREIPGEIVDVLVTPASGLDRRAAVLRRLTRAWFRAAARLRREPQSAAAVVAPREQLTPAQFLASLSGLHLTTLEENSALLSGRDHALADALARHARWRRVQDPAFPTIHPEALLTDLFVRAGTTH